MKRRLLISRALMGDPELVVLDEPTTGLDPQARLAVWNALDRLRRRGVTLLLTTHYMEEADRLADQLAIVDHGTVVAEGSPDALKGDLRGDAVHLDLPSGADVGAATAILENLPHVRDLRVTGRALSAVPGILAALERAGLPVAAVTVARPSLDDVYLRHTGHRYTSNRPEDEEPQS
jgi:ABC-2 type transport system ATP-binding protein